MRVILHIRGQDWELVSGFDDREPRRESLSHDMSQSLLRDAMADPLHGRRVRHALAGEQSGVVQVGRMTDDAILRHLSNRLTNRTLRLVPAGVTKPDRPGGSSGGGSSAPKKPPVPPPRPPRPRTPKDPDDAPVKELKAHWQETEAYCGDTTHVIGEGKNLGGATRGVATVTAGGKAVASLSGSGSDYFDLPWAVKDVVVQGDAAPDKKDVTAELKAAGLTAKTPKPLAVIRVPDVAATPISFARASGIYSWTAAFKLAVKKGTVEVSQTLQILPAWLGKWVSFVQAQDGRSGWAFVKKVNATWKYWDSGEAAANKWKPLPRPIGRYTVTDIFFIKSGSKFVGREDATQEWPEAFADAPNLATKKAAWLANIHSVWDNKFDLHRKDCKSTAAGCCKWRIRVKAKWSDTPGDATVYAVWAQDWERSNAKDWFLTENRLGVAAHECGHLLGAYDEYAGGAVDTATNKIEDDSIMGQNLTKGFPRHFDGLRDEAKKIIDGATSRTWNFEVKQA